MRTVKIIDLIGPAGSGKTTLVRALCRDYQFELIRSPYFRRIKDFPFFFQNTLSLTPTFAKLAMKSNGKLPAPRLIAWMVILQGWHRILQQKLHGSKHLILLDEGPIVHLNFLYVNGPKVLRGSSLDHWWKSMYRNYAATLDLVIWLDAPNPVLTKRIRNRSNWHGVKTKSDLQAYEYLDNVRNTYKRIIANMAVEVDHPEVICFDTEKQSYDEIIEEVITLAGIVRSDVYPDTLGAK